MTANEKAMKKVMDLFHERYGERVDEFLVPPPVLFLMRGEVVDVDLEAKLMIVRFPILPDYLNPYRTVQGGIIAAAVDNTIGPLSMLVAPPNVTRRLEMTYGRPVTPDLDAMVVEAQLVEHKDRLLHFKAEVRDPSGTRLARAKATHWVVE
ncbi:PaaI family thioesterase [candidate division KSB1 bacterium]|nr:PaaI family thioesterase [candidate division KSB1 bacterium]